MRYLVMTGGEDWYSYIEGSIFSKVQAYINEKNGSTVYCTSDSKNVAGTKFPCVYIHELQGIDRTNTLRNNAVGAVLYSVQIDIYAKTKATAKKLMRYAVAEMKDLRFSVSQMPVDLMDGTDIHHTVARFRRLFADGDNLDYKIDD